MITKQNKKTKITARLQKQARLKAPDSAQWHIDMEYFKKGCHGLVYVFKRIEQEWFRTTITMMDINIALKSSDRDNFSIGDKIKGERR